MPLKSEVLDRFLLAKSFLSKIRYQTAAEPDRYSLAGNILVAHDAAELAIAGICDQLGCLPRKRLTYLMDYFDTLKKTLHDDQDVHAKDYFHKLNNARNSLKHQGVLPDAKQWSRVGENTFQYIAKWCSEYLSLSFADLDESALIASPEVKELFDKAGKDAEHGYYQTVLERLSVALFIVFRENSALRGFEAGNPKTEDAIRVVGFGVHANDFLALQQFLPYVSSWGEKEGVPVWNQSQYGHPGNWTQWNIDFCLRTFVDVAIKLQGASWIPAAIRRFVLYDQQIEAVKDGVEIWKDVPEQEIKSPWEAYTAKQTRKILRVLSKGETVRGVVSFKTESWSPTSQILAGGAIKSKNILHILSLEKSGDLDLIGEVLAADVKVTCVPSDNESIRKSFPWLPSFDWNPE